MSINEQVKTHESVKTVTNFLSHIWFNPTVNQATLDFRSRSLEKYALFAKNTGLSLNYSIALLAGSAVWVPAPNSDVDVSYTTVSETIGQHELQALAKGNGVDLVDYNVFPRMFRLTSDPVADFFIIPDEYAVGNLELLHVLRLKALEHIERRTNIWEDWNSPDSYMNNFLSEYYTNWGSSTKHNSKRILRFNRAILEAFKTEAIPGAAILDYLRFIQELKFPPFKTFKEALELTGGELTLK